MIFFEKKKLVMKTYRLNSLISVGRTTIILIKEAENNDMGVCQIASRHNANQRCLFVFEVQAGLLIYLFFRRRSLHHEGYHICLSAVLL